MLNRLIISSILIVVVSTACAGKTPAPSTLTLQPPTPIAATPQATLIPVTLTQIEPAQAAPGDRVQVIGKGGYLFTPPSGYNESARNLNLFFDGKPAGTIACYTNRCEAPFTIPRDTHPGPHEISVEGGSKLVLNVLAASAPPTINARPTPQAGPWAHQIQSATSTDGLTWTLENRVLLEHASVPASIVTGDGKIRIYYVDASQNPETTNCAESADGGKTFKVLNCTIANRANEKALDPSIVRLPDGRYRLYYYAATGNPDTKTTHSIYSAISGDGVQFTQEQKVFDYAGLVDPDVFWTGKEWLMYVFSLDASTTIIARSGDGLKFDYVGNLELKNWGTVAPLKLDDGRFRLYAFSQSPVKEIASFISTDAIHWTREPGLRFAIPAGKEITDPFVVRLLDGTWKMIFKINDLPIPPGGQQPPPQAPRPTSITPSMNTLPGAANKDVTYCTPDGIAQKMDVLYPAKPKANPTPVAVYIHGGGWTSGDKSTGAGATDTQEILARGYVVVAVNYRLAPMSKWPAQIIDVKCAIRHLRANANLYKIDANKIGVWGGSAGGHLVSMLGTTDKSAGFDVDEYLDQSSRVQAVADLFGPADLPAMFPSNAQVVASRVFGSTSRDDPILVKASPMTYITPDDPPFLILQGDKDTTVPPAQSQELYDKLRAGGVNATLVIVKNAGHGFTPTGGVINPSRSEISKMIGDFFDKWLR